jgi:hypothetical protein
MEIAIPTAIEVTDSTDILKAFQNSSTRRIHHVLIYLYSYGPPFPPSDVPLTL